MQNHCNKGMVIQDSLNSVTLNENLSQYISKVFGSTCCKSSGASSVVLLRSSIIFHGEELLWSLNVPDEMRWRRVYYHISHSYKHHTHQASHQTVICPLIYSINNQSTQSQQVYSEGFQSRKWHPYVPGDPSEPLLWLQLYGTLTDRLDSGNTLYQPTIKMSIRNTEFMCIHDAKV